MEEDSVNFQFDLKSIKLELYKGVQECQQRGLIHSAKWLSGQLLSLSDIPVCPKDNIYVPFQCTKELDKYFAAKCFFDAKEYDRCAFYTRNCTEPLTRFLHFYSRYMSNEKKRIENMTEAQTPPDPTKNEVLKVLRNELQLLYNTRKLDGYELYLYGIVLKKLDLSSTAVLVLIEAIHESPINWSAWLELSHLISDKAKLESLHLPNHWIKHFFYAETLLDMLFSDEALEMYENLQEAGFKNNQHISVQLAIAHHNRRDIVKAKIIFDALREDDPYQIDNLDIYSNLLYVKEFKVELANLAHHVIKVDKYRVETCCVVANYYSLRGDHQKAVLYFQRALKLNPYYLSAWTLMGHEYMEMKNTNAAIHSYRQAIEINKRDYRAWYGLGQTYEILKMPSYSVYYYKQAQQLQPTDSRMLIALGDSYDKADKFDNALKCYHKACQVGDVEGIALLKLAKLSDRLGHVENAAAAFTKFCVDGANLNLPDLTELFQAYQYLANYHLRRQQLDEANTYAFKCLEHSETKEEGKALLRTIASIRGDQVECNTETPMEDSEEERGIFLGIPPVPLSPVLVPRDPQSPRNRTFMA